MINFLERSEKRAPCPVDVEGEIAQPVEQGAVEWHLLLEEAMGVLTLKERDVIKALVVEGKRAGDVARDAAIDVSHVYRIRRKALARLRTALGLSAPPGGQKRG
jgi:RNA polymerase sporulation-specific sigma factor